MPMLKWLLGEPPKDRPFKIGDRVLDDQGQEGTIINIDEEFPREDRMLVQFGQGSFTKRYTRGGCDYRTGYRSLWHSWRERN